MDNNDIPNTKKVSKNVCPFCKKVFEWKSGLSRHLRLMHVDNTKMHKCNVCTAGFLNLSGLNIHRRIHNQNTYASNNIIKPRAKISNIYKNVVSETLYSSDSDCEYELLQTIVKVNNSDTCHYLCKYCDKKFISQNNLNLHTFKKHGNINIDQNKSINKTSDRCLTKNSIDSSNKEFHESNAIAVTDSKKSDEIFKCTFCKRSFKHLSNLINHRKLHLKQSMVQLYSRNMSVNKKYRCKICKRTYSQKIYLENHIHLHKKGQIYESITEDLNETGHLCKICGETFRSSSYLSVHLQIHLVKKQYLCSTCGKSFALEKYLFKHQKTHTQEKLFRCEYCNKRFIHKATLVEHLRIHSGIKPHECTICNKKFTHYSGLTQHLRTHSDEKKYVCDVCGKGFRFGGHYREHMRTHTGDKPYNCDECDRKFALKGSLVVHQRTHSGERPFKCTTCKKGFIKNCNLKQHFKSHPQCREVKVEVEETIVL